MKFEELRNAVEQSDARWSVAEEPMSLEGRLGYVPGPDEPSLVEQEEMALSNAAPEQAWGAGPLGGPALPKVDLRDMDGKNFITDIKDQETCGSCVAFGTSAAVEGTLQMQEDNPALGPDLSEAQIFYCFGGAAGRTCGGPMMGWYPAAALDSIRDNGVAQESFFPYAAGDQACSVQDGWEASATSIAGWTELTSVEAMKEWLQTQGPLVAGMKVYSDFAAYAEGVYKPVSTDDKGGHCICVVGYDDGEGCWIAKNSWGTRFGEGGFFRIAYGVCGIDSSMWGVQGVSQ